MRAYWVAGNPRISGVVRRHRIELNVDVPGRRPMTLPCREQGAPRVQGVGYLMKGCCARPPYLLDHRQQAP